MDYQGQNVNPNLTPDMGQSVAAPNILETPNLSHDVQGMGAVGSSAAKDAIEQMMQESLADQDVINDNSNVIDLLNERPPLSPAEMPEVTSGEIEEALKDADAADEAQKLADKEAMMHGDTISQEMAKKMDDAIDDAGKNPAEFNEKAFAMIDEMVEKLRGHGIGEK